MRSQKMSRINWCGYDWITNERWGEVHPDKPNWWYDSSCVEIDGFDNLHLKTKYNPKYFSDLDTTSNIGVGLVSCVEKFKQGTYIINAKLPKGKNLWPAFWMWSWDSWPPEIDIFEGYSNNKSSYFKFRPLRPFGFWNVQTNVHYTKNNKNKMSGGKTRYFGFKNPTSKFIEYKLIWDFDYLKFYYNGILVRTIDDVEIMSQINNTHMNVIINNGVTNDVDVKNPPISDFIIKNFEYKKNHSI